jgi:predicted acetylornithine/succinylornithine family transaminase
MGKLSETTVEKFKKYIVQTYAPEMLIVKGKGSEVWDDDNRRYLDFATGISVCNLGHCHDKVTKAIQEQAAKLVHVSNLYFNEVTPLLAEKLVANAFDGAVFFANSGAEANEGMIKLARKFGSESGRYEIISMVDSFHGRTLATLAATGRAKYRKGFAPDMPGFKQVPFNDFEALKAAVSDKTCAIMLEPLQGEGGIIPADKEYLRKVRALCDEKNLLLLFDEVQCGMGRTGNLFAFKTFEVEPDVVSMAKAIANGMPMGAFLVRRKYADVLKPGEHASTFGGTPLASRAALAVLETIEEENLLENCRKVGDYLMSNLAEIVKPYSFVRGVRGVGLMIGIDLDHNGGALRKVILDNGLIVLTAGETVVRLLPALNITQENADEALAIIKKSLAEYSETLKK